MDSFRYRAFISYSHADEKWARWLHRSLEGYRIPKRLVGQQTAMGPIPAKLAPIFRDREELASATDLGSTLTAALEGSACLIVICSRAAAQSHWVNEELLAYKRLGRSGRVFSLIVDGEPYASYSPGEEDRECFPPALRLKLDASGNLTRERAEPIAADARPGKDGKANARVKLIAGILGVGLDDLRQRELQRRNRRLAVITASATAGMVVAIGLATLAVIARNEAEHQRARAEKEAETARRTAAFMVDLFAVSDPSEARGQTITAREILTQGARKVSTELGDQPEIQTSLMDTIGKVYTSLGLYTDARDLLTETVELRRDLPTIPRIAFAESAYHLANVLTEQAEYDRAQRLYREALSALETANAPDRQLEIDINAGLAELYFRTGQYTEAEPLLQRVLDRRLQLSGKDDPAVADAMEKIGLNLFDQGSYEEAEERLQQSLELRERIYGTEPHPDISANIASLALTRKLQGHFAEAEALYKRSLDMNLRLYGDVHPSVASNKTDLADIYAIKGSYEQAETMYQDVLAMYRKLLGDKHPQIAIVMNNLAFLYYDDRRVEKAIETSRAALEMQREVLADRHPDIAASLAVQGRWLTELGDYAVAEEALREALGIQLEALDPDHPRLATTRIDLAELLISTGELDEALEQAQRGQASLELSLGDEHWRTAAAKQTHGAALLALGRYAPAEPLLTQSYSGLSHIQGVSRAVVKRGLQRLVTLYQASGQTASARSYRTILERDYGSS